MSVLRGRSFLAEAPSRLAVESQKGETYENEHNEQHSRHPRRSSVSVFDTLLAWDKALNAHGIPAWFEYKVFNEGDFDEERGEYLCVCLDDHHWAFSDMGDDHSAAEFISRVTEQVFGAWAYYRPIGDGWALHLDNGQEPQGHIIMVGVPVVNGHGKSRLEALLNALQSLPVKEEGS